jgi:hypothetical protein
MEMLFIESKTPNYTGRSKFSVRGFKTFFLGQKQEFAAGRRGTEPQRKKGATFFEVPGLNRVGWYAMGMLLRKKDLDMRNQLRWSRIQLCEAATGRIDPSAVLPNQLGGGMK